MGDQRGAQTVEIALTFSTFIVILVGMVELIRVLWVWTLLGEATRRAARVAAVCELNSPAIYRAATELPGAGLTDKNIAVTYHYCVSQNPMSASCDQLQSAGWGPDEMPDVNTEASLHSASQSFVQVGIRDFHPPFAFLFAWANPSDTFLQRLATTLPAESLGWSPSGGDDDRGGFEPCP